VLRARRPAAYGSTNKYRPVKNCKARGMTANRPREFVYLFFAMAKILMTTAAVKAIDNQRWVCRIHLFQFNLASSQPPSRIAPRLTVRFNTKPALIGCQPLPGRELRRDSWPTGDENASHLQSATINISATLAQFPILTSILFYVAKSNGTHGSLQLRSEEYIS
jgi:hypothetical protein